LARKIQGNSKGYRNAGNVLSVDSEHKIAKTLIFAIETSAFVGSNPTGCANSTEARGLDGTDKKTAIYRQWQEKRKY
jgi:hypothetical protein